MHKKNMGSVGGRPAIPLAEASERIGVKVSILKNWLARGLFEPVYRKTGEGQQRRTRPHIYVDELETLRLVASRPEGVDVATTDRRALQAYALARAAHRRLDELAELLGLNRTSLDMSEPAVRDLYQQVGAKLTEVDPPTSYDLRQWAAIFFAVDEPYLLLTERYCRTEEPWKLFLDLSHKLVLETPQTELPFDAELRAAFAYVRAAQQQLRSASYLYCRERHGPSMANRVFEGGNRTVTERIMALMFHA